MSQSKPSPVFMASLVFGFLSLIVSSAAAQNLNPSKTQPPPQKTPLEIQPGWTVFRGQSGLIVSHPAGWQIQERKNGAFLAYRPGSGGVARALVLVEPIQKIDGRAMGVVQGLGQIFPDLFPNVNVFKSRLVSQNPEVAVAEMQFAPSGQPFRGLVMCFKKDNRGVLYAIAASTPAWSQDEPVMKQILSRFFYSGGAPPEGGTPSTGALPPMVSWSDPKEGAFTYPVPQGWEVEGGTFRLAPLDMRQEILVTSPDKKVLVRIGDTSIPSFSLPGQMTQSAGMTEGMWSISGGVKALVMRYLPGFSFLTQYYLPQRVGPISNVRTRNYAEMAQKIQAQRSRVMPVQIDAGDVTFEAQTETGHRKGYGGVQTSMTPFQGTPGEGSWRVEILVGYLAAPEAEPVAQAVLNRMIAGGQTNQNWSAQQSRFAGEISKIWSQTQSETSEIIRQSYENRSKAMDRSHERWSRAFRGEVLIEDPYTKQRYEVPSGSNYYWRVGSGNEFVGTETHSPDLPLHYLHQMRIID
jgi:hypothetical protein